MTSSIQHRWHWEAGGRGRLAAIASGPLWLAAAMLLALALSVGDAGAAPRCKAAGASCMKNSNCCSGQCSGVTTGRKHAPGVCAPAGSPNGEACSANSQCASGHCVEGTCCNTACTGSCFTCDGGTCAAKAAGEWCDDGLFCTQTDACNGSGSCQGSGATCPLESQSNECALCDEATDSCSQSEGHVCGLANGQPCDFAYQCGSSFCVEGVCCDSDCTGYCESCSDAKTSYGDGTCAPVIALTDPDDDCAEGPCMTGLCDGNRGCGAVEAGTDPNEDCPDVPCMTGSCANGGVCGLLTFGTSCDDGEGCSQTDHCDDAGACVSSTANGCGTTPEGWQCFCNETTDTCSFEEGSQCNP